MTIKIFQISWGGLDKKLYGNRIDILNSFLWIKYVNFSCKNSLKAGINASKVDFIQKSSVFFQSNCLENLLNITNFYQF